VFLAEGMPEKDALARANLYAALSTTRVGTQKSFPTRADFEAEWARAGGIAGRTISRRGDSRVIKCCGT